MASGDVTRRRFLETGVATAAFVGAPFVRSAHAAGSLSVAFWDHWVPGGNKATEEIARAWAEKEKVDLKIDFVTSQGNKNLLTIAAEAQAKSGHDIFAFPTWYVHEHVNQLEPVDDIMPELIKQNGNVNGTVDYLAKVKGRWMAVPSTPGSQIKGPCSRIDLMKQHAGIDVVAMYPAGEAPKADNWNMETFLKAAEACHKAGVPFGIGLGQTTDSTDTIGAFFQSFGAELVDKDGKITVKSDNVRVAMEYLRKLAAVLPPDAPAWDDASNNKWLVSGRGALICNPPSAWAVAKRDAPDIAKQCWTHGMPAGPRGRFAPYLPYLWGIWSFSRNKSAAKSLLVALSTHEAIARMVEVSGGYDLPAYEKLTTLKTWAEAEPPKGTLYHYPNPHNHQTLSIAAAPAPPNIANQIYNQAIMTKMVARHLGGER
ncbi:MAG: transporter substrate-binding protein, partial [Enterovirga sp.]|nr:transporter substrate-binding protein [Enterovirga sp.]